MTEELTALLKLLDWNRKSFLLIAQYPDNHELHRVICKYGFAQNHQFKEYIKEFDIVHKKPKRRTKFSQSEEWLDSLYALEDDREEEETDVGNSE
jgi:hypothetical protein